MEFKVERSLCYRKPDDDNGHLRLSLSSVSLGGHEAMWRMTSAERAEVQRILAEAMEHTCRIIAVAASRLKE